MIQLILAIIATIFTGCVLIFVSVGVSRRNKALSGHESTGLVKNVYYTNQYSLSYVEFEFVNDYNETSICKAFIEVNSIKDLQSLQIEREIPIYVNGKLAFYDADGINNGKLAQQYSDINENN